MVTQKNLITFILAIAMFFALAACSALPSDIDDGIAANTTISVVDQGGRTVEIEYPVERLVSGFYISSSTILALGLSDRLVGIEARADERPVYTRMFPELLELPNVGTARDFNLEACIALYPDLVVLPYRLRDAAETLTDMGIPAIVVNPESFDELVDMINLIGVATNTVYRAERLIEWMVDTRDYVIDISAQFTELPTVYIAGVGSHLSTSPGGMFQSDLVEMAGGINVAADLPGRGWTEISYEQLLAMNPDIIILPAEASYTVEDVLTNPTLSGLTAVTNGSVYQFSNEFEAWDSPIPSSMIGALWLLSVLHGHYAGQDFLEFVHAFYSEFYGFSG
ncbi:MAG: ABC transporter substrate-binding protein [Oscillospiraceae bacterium]|nr:ABC transporter substrate-binding protein [Oscillospiraceae bacterium]